MLELMKALYVYRVFLLCFEINFKLLNIFSKETLQVENKFYMLNIIFVFGENMKLLHLDTPMKLMNKNNVSFDVDTHFKYLVPTYIYDMEDLEVVCSLKNNTTMEYSLSESFKKLLSRGTSQQDIEKRIEGILWGLSTYKEVVVQDSLEPALLIKEKLFVKA